MPVFEMEVVGQAHGQSEGNDSPNPARRASQVCGSTARRGLWRTCSGGSASLFFLKLVGCVWPFSGPGWGQG